MDTDAIKRDEVRGLRGKILRALHRVFGSDTPAMTAESLQRVVRPLGRRQYEEALAYLVSTGYVERKEEKLDAMDQEPEIFLALTSKGARVMEGIETDAMIAL